MTGNVSSGRRHDLIMVVCDRCHQIVNYEDLCFQCSGCIHPLGGPGVVCVCENCCSCKNKPQGE